MFQFPGFAPIARYHAFSMVGCPIRKSTDQILFADPRSLSQLITSFFASESLGIPHTPLITSFNDLPYQGSLNGFAYPLSLVFLCARSVKCHYTLSVLKTPTTLLFLLLSLLLFHQYVNELLHQFYPLRYRSNG